MQQSFDMGQLMDLARSPAGQQLIRALRESGSMQVEKAAALASSGELEQAKAVLSPLLDSPQIRQLMKQLEGQP